MAWVHIRSYAWREIEELQECALLPPDSDPGAFAALKIARWTLTHECESIPQWLERWLEEGLERVRKRVSDEDLGTIRSSGAFEITFGISLLCHLNGNDQTELWQKIARLPEPDDVEARLMQTILKRAIGTRDVAPDASTVVRGLPKTPRLLLKTLTTAAPDFAFDIANCPAQLPFADSAAYVFLLAYAWLRQQGRPVDRRALAEVLRWGAHPERRGDVLYQLKGPRSVPGTPVAANELVTWPPFVLIERKDDELVAYWWAGPTYVRGRHDRPMDTELRDSEQLDWSWKRVEHETDEAVWREIARYRNAGKCRYVAIVDSSVQRVSRKRVDEVSKKLNANVGVFDLTEV